MAIHHPAEIDIGAGRLKKVMKPCGPPDSKHIGLHRVWDEIDAVRDAGIDGMAFVQGPFNRDMKVQLGR